MGPREGKVHKVKMDVERKINVMLIADDENNGPPSKNKTLKIKTAIKLWRRALFLLFLFLFSFPFGK